MLKAAKQSLMTNNQNLEGESNNQHDTETTKQKDLLQANTKNLHFINISQPFGVKNADNSYDAISRRELKLF